MDRYIILSYTTIPRDNKVTHTKGWRDTPNATQYNETVAFKKNIKVNDVQTARMILDTRNKTVEKNGFPEDITYDKAYQYLKKHYPKYFADA